MSKIKTLVKLLIQDPKMIFAALGRNGFFKWLPDKLYLEILYYCNTGNRLNLEKPNTFNEKLQWLKLYDRKPIYTSFVDKYAVREHVKHTIGEKHLISLIGVYNKVDEIPWDTLPDKFVLKCTHGSGCNIICTNKDLLDIKEAERKLRKWMNKNYFWHAREWPYKNVKPRIICEKYITDLNGEELKDYKIYCFQGEPQIVHVDIDKFNNHRRNIYSLDWELLDARINYPNDTTGTIPKPTNLNLLLSLSKSITSPDHPHVRTDFYTVGEKIYFGEMTFYNGGGFELITPESLSVIMGDWIKLVPRKQIND